MHGGVVAALCLGARAAQIVNHFADNLAFQDIRFSYLCSQLNQGARADAAAASRRRVSPYLGGKYYVCELQREYAARAQCWHTYHTISQDVLHRCGAVVYARCACVACARVRSCGVGRMCG
jgi:hypothetical protein